MPIEIIKDIVKPFLEVSTALEGSGVKEQGIEALKQGAKELIEGAKDVLEKDAPEKRGQIERVIIGDQGKAQAEQRESLEENFKKLEAKFDEKHQDTEPAKREDLQKQLQEKFDQVRAQLDAKQEADRQRTIEDLERIRS